MNYLFPAKQEKQEKPKTLFDVEIDIDIDVPENSTEGTENSENSEGTEGTGPKKLSEIFKQNVEDYHQKIKTQATLCIKSLEEDGIISFFEERIKYKIIEHCSIGDLRIAVLEEINPETSEMYKSFQIHILKFGEDFVKNAHENNDYETKVFELLTERLEGFLKKEGFKESKSDFFRVNSEGYDLTVSISNNDRHCSEIVLRFKYFTI